MERRSDDSPMVHSPDPGQPPTALAVRLPPAGTYGWRSYGVHWVQLDAPRHRVLPTVGGFHLLRRARELNAWGGGDQAAFSRPEERHLAGLTRRGYHLLRRARRAGLQLVSPIDELANYLNGKRPFPPIDMRREVGGLSTFESAAGEIMAALELLAGLMPSSRVFDMGCGCGALPIVMRRRARAPFLGQYAGVDVDPRLVDWCARHLGDEHFRFEIYDYHNASYNPEGQRFLPFPVPDDWADVVLMKSVITHMLPADVAFYMEELARVLKPPGRALVTAWLFGEDDTDVAADFPHVGDGGRFRYTKEASPESAIALSEEWLLPVLEKCGLAWELHRGAQRLIVLRHADAP